MNYGPELPHDFKERRRIDAVAMDNRVMQVLVTYQVLNEGTGSLEDGLVWTDTEISRLMHHDDVEAVHMALQRLLARGWVTRRRNEWVKTTDGEDEFRAEIRDPRLKLSPQEFKREALTGVDKRGKQSTLTRAALPGKELRERRNADQHRNIVIAGYVRDVAEMLGISPEEAHRGLFVEQSIRLCKGFGDRGEHVGVFHRRGQNGWQHLCTECRKKVRKK
jgi:hypothetical protein